MDQLLFCVQNLFASPGSPQAHVYMRAVKLWKGIQKIIDNILDVYTSGTQDDKSTVIDNMQILVYK